MHLFRFSINANVYIFEKFVHFIYSQFFAQLERGLLPPRQLIAKITLNAREREREASISPCIGVKAKINI